MPAPGTGNSEMKLNDYGLDAVCADIGDGITLEAIRKNVGVSVGALCAWLTHPDRAQRVTDARRSTAKQWDEKAEAVLLEAKDKFEVYKARELAHHYRWRAGKIAPNEFGNKVQHQTLGADGSPVDPPSSKPIDLEQALKGWKGEHHLHKVAKDIEEL